MQNTQHIQFKDAKGNTLHFKAKIDIGVIILQDNTGVFSISSQGKNYEVVADCSYNELVARIEVHNRNVKNVEKKSLANLAKSIISILENEYLMQI